MSMNTLRDEGLRQIEGRRDKVIMDDSGVEGKRQSDWLKGRRMRRKQQVMGQRLCQRVRCELCGNLLVGETEMCCNTLDCVKDKALCGCILDQRRCWIWRVYLQMTEYSFTFRAGDRKTSFIRLFSLRALRLSLTHVPPPLHCRGLVFDKGIKNGVKRRHSLQLEEHLAQRQGLASLLRGLFFPLSVGRKEVEGQGLKYKAFEHLDVKVHQKKKIMELHWWPKESIWQISWGKKTCLFILSASPPLSFPLQTILNPEDLQDTFHKPRAPALILSSCHSYLVYPPWSFSVWGSLSHT